MRIGKNDLKEGEHYLLEHKDQGSMVATYNKFEAGKLVFTKIMGGIDFRFVVKVRPNMARYYTLPILDVDIISEEGE